MTHIFASPESPLGKTGALSGVGACSEPSQISFYRKVTVCKLDTRAQRTHAHYIIILLRWQAACDAAASKTELFRKHPRAVSRSAKRTPCSSSLHLLPRIQLCASALLASYDTNSAKYNHLVVSRRKLVAAQIKSPYRIQSSTGVFAQP